MFMHRLLLTLVFSGLLLPCASRSQDSTAALQSPKLGKPASPELVSSVDISIPPSGYGLPAGSGSVLQGSAVYAAKCQSCHGEKGVGKPADALVGGINTLASGRAAIRTVGSYWPFATTLFDYVRRSMPTSAPQSLSNDEVYAVTAYILNLNNIVDVDSVMNSTNLPNVKMPNREGFIDLSGKK